MREWWLRTVVVLQAPRAVFVALREDTPEAAADRAEPVLLIVLLAGVASVLSTHAAAHLMDDHDYDGLLLVAVWAVLAGFLYGGVAYWLFGGILHFVVRRLGSQGTFRRTRHLLAFACVPIALSLVLWPVKLALFGDDLFRRGGSDTGPGAEAFEVLTLAFGLWALALLGIGVRAVHGWTWARSFAAVAGAIVIPAALVVGLRAV